MAVAEYTWNPLTDSVIEETDGAGNVLVEYTNEPAPYGPLISERRGSDTRQYHFDALGSTRALTDDSQNVTDTFAYDAWGDNSRHAGFARTLFRWAGLWGYLSDNTSKSTYVRARTYLQGMARWSSVDPLTVLDNTVKYDYSASNPVTNIDPSGEKCVVCGDAWHSYHNKIATLDAFYIGTPFRDAADGHTAGLNASLQAFGVSYPDQVPSTGLLFVRLKGKRAAALHFLFFVVFDICETEVPPGGCRLFLDETGSIVTLNGADGGFEIKKRGRNEGDVTGNSYVGKLFVPLDTCDKSLIFTDLPGGSVNLGVAALNVKLRQKIDVRDSATGQVVATTNTMFDFSVDLNGNITPRADFKWEIVPK